jgi:Tol biopolymer transport system component
LASLIERCLQQDATSRVQHMEEVRLTLERLRSESPKVAGRRWTKPAWIAALLAMAVAAVVLTWKVTASGPQPAPPSFSAQSKSSDDGAKAGPSKPAEQPSPAAAPAVQTVPRAPLAPPALATLASYPGMERDPSFSPDGARVAFSWHRDVRSGYGIYVRLVKGEEAPASLTDGNSEDWGPAWSPNGRRIAFRRRGGESGIYWVKASGGPANLITPIARQDQETLPQLSWSHDGKWIAAPDRDSGTTHIYLFAVESGERRALTSNATGTDHAPAFSPDGKSLAYASCRSGVSQCDVYVIDLGRDLMPKQRRRITDQGVYIRGIAWLPDGHSLVYSAGSTRSQDTFLWRVAVNPPGLPERIDMAGARARHPAISLTGGLLAYTRLNNWTLMLIKNFR